MLVLGIDSTCKSAGAALSSGRKVIGRIMQADAHTHSVKLLPEIQSLLESNGVRPADIGLIAVNTGPGSFTGIRIGATTAKTMAYSLSIPVVGVNTLDSLMLSHTRPCDRRKDLLKPVLALIDARGVRAYGCLYAAGKRVSEQFVGDVSDLIGSIPADLYGKTVTVCGDAVLNEKISRILREEKRFVFDVDPERAYPDPAAVCALGLRQYEKTADRSFFLPEKLTLNYMKEWL